MSTENSIERAAGFLERQRRCEQALEEFKRGGDPRVHLSPEEFEEVQMVANTAVENKLTAMVKTAKAAVQSEVGQ